MSQSAGPSTSPRNPHLFCDRCGTAFTWREGRTDVPGDVSLLVLCPHCRTAYDTHDTQQGMTLTPSDLRFERRFGGLRVIEGDTAATLGRYGLEAYGGASAIVGVRDPENIFETTPEIVGYAIAEPLLPASYDRIEVIFSDFDGYRKYYRVVLFGKVGLQLVRFDTEHEHVDTVAVVPARYDRLAMVELHVRGPMLAFVRGRRFEVFECRDRYSDTFACACTASSWDRLVAKTQRVLRKQKLPPLSAEQLQKVREELQVA